MANPNPYESPRASFEAPGRARSTGGDTAFQMELQATWGPQRDRWPIMPDRPVGATFEVKHYLPSRADVSENFRRETDEATAKKTENPDGSKVWTNARGQVIRVDHPGRATQRYSYDDKGNLQQIDQWVPDQLGILGRVTALTKNKDGTWQTVSADGKPLDQPWKGTIKVNPDGSTLAKAADGTTTFSRRDGSSETKNRDGSLTSRNRLGEIVKVQPPTPAERRPASKPGRPGGSGAGDGGSAGKSADKLQTARKAGAPSRPDRPGAARGKDAPAQNKPTDLRKRPKDTSSDRKKVDPNAPLRVQKLADGSTVAYFRNGDKVTTYAKPTMAGVRQTVARLDGSRTDEHVDGHKSTLKKDGTKIFEYPNGNQHGVIKHTERPDGSSISQWKDGSNKTIKPDNDPPQMLSRADGTDTYYFRDGSQLVQTADGSLTQVMADGTSVQLPATMSREELRNTYGYGAGSDG